MSLPFIVIEEVNMVNCIESHTINLLSFVRGPSLCHREKAVGIYIQYILLASRYVFSKYILLYQVLMYNIHVKKYSLFALRSPFFVFFPFFVCSGWNNSHLSVTGSWMAVELKSTVLFFVFFNSYHIHIGICIEGTSMHLDCLHDKWKAVLPSGKKKNNKSF